MSNDYCGPERRNDVECPMIGHVENRFSDGTKRMERIESSIEELKAAHERFEKKLDENTERTNAAAASTAEILDIMSTAKGFFRGVGYIGSIVKWGLGIATAIVAFVVALKTGKTP